MKYNKNITKHSQILLNITKHVYNIYWRFVRFELLVKISALIDCSPFTDNITCLLFWWSYFSKYSRDHVNNISMYLGKYCHYMKSDEEACLILFFVRCRTRNAHYGSFVYTNYGVMFLIYFPQEWQTHVYMLLGTNSKIINIFVDY